MQAASAYFRAHFPATHDVIWSNPTDPIAKAAQVEIAGVLIDIFARSNAGATLAGRLQTDFASLLASAMTKSTQDALSGSTALAGDIGKSVAEGLAVSTAAALATDALFLTPPMRDTHPRLEGPLRAMVNATIVEMYDLQRAARDPSLLLGKVLERILEVKEIYDATKLLAATQTKALVATTLNIESTALTAAQIGGTSGDTLLRLAMRDLELSTKNAVGADDAVAVQGIFEMGLQALYAHYRGATDMARAQAAQLPALGKDGANIHPFSALTKPGDWAINAINMGRDASQVAVELVLGSTALATYLEPVRTPAAAGPANLPYSSWAEGQVYGEYEKTLPRERVAALVATTTKSRSGDLYQKWAWATSEIFLADLRAQYPKLALAHAGALRLITGLNADERARVFLLAAMAELAELSGLTLDELRLLNDGRNINQGQTQTVHPTLADVDGQPGWTLRPAFESVFHAAGHDPDDIRKYTHTAGCEYVFRRDGDAWVFVNDGVNTGTFNYAGGLYGHALLDIFPWILWGIGPEEKTDFSDRLRLARDNGFSAQARARMIAVLGGAKPLPAAPPPATGDCGARPRETTTAPDATAEANAAFVRAITAYRAALALEGDARRAALEPVGDQFERIVTDYPATRPAKAIAARQVPGVDFALLTPPTAPATDAATDPAPALDVAPGLYAIDPALCALEPTLGDAWGTLFQRLSQDGSVTRGAERNCRINAARQDAGATAYQADCTAEGAPETATWRWARLSDTSFQETEGRYAGQTFTLCAPAPQNADSDPAAPQTSPGRWGPDIVVPAAISLRPSQCAGQDLRQCLSALGVQGAAIDFALAFDPRNGGDTVARRFEELGAVDMARVSVIYSPYEIDVLLNASPDIMRPMPTRDLGATFGDATSRAFLAANPQATSALPVFSAHRRLPDGTQRFVLHETLTAACRACPTVGSAISFLDFAPTPGAPPVRSPVGLIGLDPATGQDLTPQALKQHPERLQERLNALGYNAGEMDGYPGPQTRDALMAFQAEHCLPPTGQPDAATLNALVATNRRTAPCAGATPPAGISANAPLLVGIYVDDTAHCARDDIPFAIQHTALRIVRPGSITFGVDRMCTTRRTDIRDGLTLFRGTCAQGNQSAEAGWTLDVMSPNRFGEAPSAAATGARRTFVKCADTSPLRQNWAAWFPDAPATPASTTPAAQTAASTEPPQPAATPVPGRTQTSTPAAAAAPVAGAGGQTGLRDGRYTTDAALCRAKIADPLETRQISGDRIDFGGGYRCNIVTQIPTTTGAQYYAGDCDNAQPAQRNVWVWRKSGTSRFLEEQGIYRDGTDKDRLSGRIFALCDEQGGHVADTRAPGDIPPDEVLDRGDPVLSARDGVSVSPDGTVQIDFAAAEKTPETLGAMMHSFGMTLDNLLPKTYGATSYAATQQRQSLSQAISELAPHFDGRTVYVESPMLPLTTGAYDAATSQFNTCLISKIGAMAPDDSQSAFAQRVLLNFLPLAQIGNRNGFGHAAFCADRNTRPIQAFDNRFGLPPTLGRPHWLNQSVNLTAPPDRAAAIATAGAEGRLRLQYRCKMFTPKSNDGSVSIQVGYAGYCAYNEIRLFVIDPQADEWETLIWRIDSNGLSQPRIEMRPVTPIVPAATGDSADAIQPMARSFETDAVDEKAIRKIVTGFVGQPEDIDLLYRNIVPFASGRRAQSLKVYQALGDGKTYTRAGSKTGYADVYLTETAPERGLIHLDRFEDGTATAILGTIDEVRILSTRQLSGADCEWEVTYRSWLRDSTAFGDAVAQVTGKDGFTSSACFRVSRSGLEMIRKSFVDF